jgi:hypothetical protein
MKTLRDEIASRFPEVVDKCREEDGAYILMHRIVEWLQSAPPTAITAETVERLRSFWNWCEDQPRGESGKDDLYTIFIVGFWENLFDSESTRPLIPQLMPREEMLANADYLKQWVGAENYQQALDEYDRTL